MRRLVLGLALVLLATMGAAGAKKSYPYRWVRVGTRLRDAADVEKVRKIAETAANPDLLLCGCSCQVLLSLILASPELVCGFISGS